MMLPKTDKVYRTIILDFDGVLVESNEIKDKAFEMVFADYPGQITQILEYHRKTSLIRFEKFRYIVEKILKLPYSQQLEEELARKFSGYCIKEVVVCPWVRGAEEFLSYYAGRLPLYLVSINPLEDLQTILGLRKMEHYFKGVYTAQESKTSQLQDILKKQGLLPTEAVFIGDALSDYTSAKEAGINFIGRRSSKGSILSSSQSPFEGLSVPVFDDFYEILRYIKGNTICQNI